MCFVHFLIVETPSQSSSQSVLTSTILAVVFEICTLVLMFVVILFLIQLCLRRWWQKTHSKAINDASKPFNAVYDYPVAVFNTNTQLSVLQRIDTMTEAANTCSMRQQIPEAMDVETKKNVAYGIVKQLS